MRHTSFSIYWQREIYDNKNEKQSKSEIMLLRDKFIFAMDFRFSIRIFIDFLLAFTFNWNFCLWCGQYTENDNKRFCEYIY